MLISIGIRLHSIRGEDGKKDLENTNMEASRGFRVSP